MAKIYCHINQCYGSVQYLANIHRDRRQYWLLRPHTITSNLSEVEMNICIIVYLFMSFVGHIEVKESPSKTLK